MDLLRVPIVGAVLRWRHARLAAQSALLLVAAAVVLHGFFGPQVAPRNLATVLTTIHWRGLLIVALLAAGNLFCAACPMMLARDAGRRLVPPRVAWPHRLRGKWLAVALLAGVLITYEMFDLWELPRATAWIVLAYFGAALIVDLTFRGASFCRYLCPIGQFNFVASTMSPTELRVRSLAACRSCRTADCLKGRRSAEAPARIVRRGCELGLFLPAKVGNLDCTFCLDCVKACPHDNVAIGVRAPGTEWLSTGRRSAIGRLAKRPDVAALAIVFTWAALLSAFVMTAAARGVTGWIALIVLPPLAFGAAGWLSRPAWPYAFALVPVGVGIWAAHYGFHLLTGMLTVVPVTQAAAIDLVGATAFGEPAWNLVGLRTGLVFPIQIGMVVLGSFGSAGLIQATSQRERPGEAVRAALPWLVLLAALTVLAVWLFAQPMDMRGMMAS
jgi:polyferredoxin